MIQGASEPCLSRPGLYKKIEVVVNKVGWVVKENLINIRIQAYDVVPNKVAHINRSAFDSRIHGINELVRLFGYEGAGLPMASRSLIMKMASFQWQFILELLCIDA